MRLPALATILALGVLVGFSPEMTPAAGKKTTSTPKPPPRPHYTPPRIAPAPYRGIPIYPRNYRPGAGMRMAQINVDVTFTYNSTAGKVRTLDPPENFDDKGNVKKYTKAELAALKGDTPEEKKLAGYKTDFSELKVGDAVQVSLSVHKTTSTATKPAADPKKTNPDANADADKVAKDPAPAAKDGKWVVANQLLGKVTKIDSANTDAEAKLTIRVTTMQPVSVRSRNTNVNKKQTVNPDQGQATLLVIGHRQPVAGAAAAKP